MNILVRICLNLSCQNYASSCVTNCDTKTDEFCELLRIWVSPRNFISLFMIQSMFSILTVMAFMTLCGLFATAILQASSVTWHDSDLKMTDEIPLGQCSI